MKKIIMGGLAAAVLAGGAAVVIAGTPMGGDDAGFIPNGPNAKAIIKCETGLGKGAAKLAGGIVKCHSSRVSGKITDEAGEEACEAAAATKFTSKAKLTGCGPCSSPSGLVTLVEGLVDTNNSDVYCAAGTPFGGDDTGNIPASATVGKCENTVAKGVSKLIGAIAKCHASEVGGKLVGDSAEDACESAAITKFMGLSAKISTCDPCTNLSSIASLVESKSDLSTAAVFCSNSPSGAFLE